MNEAPERQLERPTSPPDFLAGGGQMGALMRAHDWAATPVGPPPRWPQSLRTVLRLMLTTNHPVFVFWGPEHICFYNDAFRPSIGPEKHPAMLGAPGRTMWEEIWPTIGPQIDMVMAGEGATWHEDHLVPIIRHGGLDEVYWTYSYSPIDDEDAPTGVGGVLVVCSETTQKVLNERRLNFRVRFDERLRDLSDPRTVRAAATELLGRQLPAGCVGYAEIDRTDTYVTADGDWTAEGFASVAGTYRLDDYGPRMIAELRAGRTVSIADTASDPLTAGTTQEAAYKAIGTRALMNAPLVKGGRLVAVLYVLNASPRAWTRHEIALVQEVAERTWDAVERARTEAALREGEERFRQMAELSPQFIWTSGGDGSLEYVNRRWVEYSGLDFEATADQQRLALAIHANDRIELFRLWGENFGAGEAFETEARLRSREGAFRWFLIRTIPLRDDAGRIAKWIGTSTDIHAQKQEEADALFMAELSERIRLAGEAGDMLYEVARAAGVHLDVQRSFFVEIDLGSDCGRIRRDYCRGVASIAGEYRLSEYSPVTRRDIAAGRTIVNCDARDDPRTADEYEATYGPRGERAYVAVPLLRNGRWEGAFWVSTDLPRRWEARELALLETVAERTWNAVEKLRLDAELLASEAWLRLMLDGATEYAIIALDGDGRIAGWNSGAERLLGYGEAEALGRQGAIFFTAEGRAAGDPEAEMRAAREAGRAANERWHVRKDGSRFWGSGVMLPMTDGAPSAYLKIFRDRTAERQAEERQALLINELNHRVKNTLATVQSMATQTFRIVRGSTAARGLFDSRLAALARAHDVLTDQGWEGADLGDVVNRSLEPFQAGEGRIAIAGPEAHLAPPQALALSMALHELATNAAKYGALSNESGRVRIGWKVAPHDRSGDLELTWVEEGGPPVSPPKRKGFGSRLIERSLADDLHGEAVIDYRAEGVVCTFKTKLTPRASAAS